MRSMLLLSAIGEINDELIYAARKPFKKKCVHSKPKKNRILLVAAIIAVLLLCGFTAYKAGLFDPWFQTPSVSPVETVKSAIEGELEKEYTITVRIGEIKVDDDATARAKKFYGGSELAIRNGWSDEYVDNNMIVVYAEYYIEYDHEKTFQPDGETKQFFILTRNEETQEWSIWDNTTNGDPFMLGGDTDG